MIMNGFLQPGPHYTIATWNVNSVNARREHVLRFLDTTDRPDQNLDVLFLQELKSEKSELISPLFSQHTCGQKSYNGVAILTRGSSLLIQDKLDDAQDDTQARYLEIEWNGLRLINIYLPNGNPIESEKFTYKLNWMNRLYRRLKYLRERNIPFLVGGDFNVIPEDIDCFDPVLWREDALFHPKTLQMWRAIINLGIVDSYRVLHPNERQAYSFWDYQRGAWQNDLGIRIDHFLLSPSLTDRLIDCKIDRIPRSWDRPSDHTPVIVKITKCIA